MTKIYLVENCYGDPNKVYIGKTKNSRYTDHKSKFGDSIKYTIIDEINSLDKEDWKPLEVYWISQFKIWGFDILNKNKGGGGADFYTQEIKNKISKALKGRTRPSYFGEKMKISMIGKNLGKTHTGETKQKMREVRLGKPNPTKGINRKPLTEEQKINLQVPKINKENYSKPKTQKWKDSVTGKSKNHPESRNQNISNSLKGYKQSEEHILKRSSHLKGKSNLKNKKPKPEGFGENVSIKLKGKPKIYLQKAVLQYNLQGELIKEWSSITEMCIHLFNDVSKNPNITKCCQGKIKTAYNYVWKYKNHT